MAIEYVFLIPAVAVGLAAGVYAPDYLRGEAAEAKRRFWVCFAATLAAMAGVVLAPGKFTFILAWEAMGLASAGLVAIESREKEVRKATWIYLMACHAGACALMLAAALGGRPGAGAAAFACAVIGFGLKIGFPPFHSWLPDAHPAAPAPASAIMSGAMIPLGAYGLLEFTGKHLAEAPGGGATGWTLLALGAVGAVGGILFAAPQANLKRLLAYSSIENMGVVTIALGLSFLAEARGEGDAAALAMAGGLVHVVNHGFLKGALFLGAGAVLRQAGTLNQDKLGGLMKRMPYTGTLFTVNALGLAGLPPLNGFIGELAIYFAAFKCIATGAGELAAAGFAAAVALAFAGGIAAATYAKAAGTTFLGAYRGAAEVEEAPKRMWLAQLGLTVLSVGMIPGSVWFVHKWTGGAGTETLIGAACGCGLFAALTAGLIGLRRYCCVRGEAAEETPGWDCGYAEPTARMAYTATAFTQPIADLFRPALRSRKHVIGFSGPPAEPGDAAIVAETDDLAQTGFWRPLFTAAARLFQRAHLLQSGSLHLYILIILMAVLGLLAGALA